MRSSTNPHVDKEVFRHTAANTKVINLGVRLYRGGTRL